MYELYVDGACCGNPGPGGWACVIVKDLKYKGHFSDNCYETTNNEMELMAVVNGIKLFSFNYKPVKRIAIFSDSKYVIDGATKWIKNWRNNGWKTKDKQIIKNYELWTLLDKYINEMTITWNWIPGHSGNKYNEMANDIAQNASKNMKEKLKKYNKKGEFKQ